MLYSYYDYLKQLCRSLILADEKLNRDRRRLRLHKELMLYQIKVRASLEINRLFPLNRVVDVYKAQKDIRKSELKPGMRKRKREEDEGAAASEKRAKRAKFTNKFCSKEEIAKKRECDNDEGDLSPRCVKRMKLGHAQAV
ncbi:hypothetical protein G6F57_007138 [Rhizopus arrhizus]|uniref:Uncharacterized protein n=1 Tax=Rhizopus oryzae TaxID=64495 RepID=A0A9P6XIX1_RHIOR|nr:hypothetical protein G6F23_004482 [Rhizopus arrhizus]KAG1416672.1 hypothetical protein G6F58_005861 [Rhizopus delemar]KAG0762601.1 hypothetical protein G6F24_006683 [Rhizopus arrhizus]KAG0783811.1 hypothetical protein G6F22_008539 [Rhizopus arrhizus]KAG0787588.1 hypothetical protein G6F21_007806 [Rhizopus arrhizus]